MLGGSGAVYEIIVVWGLFVCLVEEEVLSK
jgi:hypothetical protein